MKITGLICQIKKKAFYKWVDNCVCECINICVPIGTYCVCEYIVSQTLIDLFF